MLSRDLNMLATIWMWSHCLTKMQHLHHCFPASGSTGTSVTVCSSCFSCVFNAGVQSWHMWLIVLIVSHPRVEGRLNPHQLFFFHFFLYSEPCNSIYAYLSIRSSKNKIKHARNWFVMSQAVSKMMTTDTTVPLLSYRCVRKVQAAVQWVYVVILLFCFIEFIFCVMYFGPVLALRMWISFIIRFILMLNDSTLQPLITQTRRVVQPSVQSVNPF